MNNVLQKTLLRLSKKVGPEYFETLVQVFCEALEMDYSFVGEVKTPFSTPEEIQTIAFAHRGNLRENIEYFLQNTPCETVVGKRTCIYSSGVQDLFPKDSGLVQRGVECYIGVPLWDSIDRPLGLMVLLGSKALSKEEEEKIRFFLELFIDRTSAELERQRTERALKESERRNRALLNAIPDMMFHVDEEGTCLNYKASQDEDRAVPPEVFLGKKVREVLPETLAEDVMDRIGKILRGSPLEVFEYQLTNQKGELRDFEARLVSVENRETLALVRDITEQKKSEEFMEKALNEKGVLLDEVHHRVKNNLQVISSLLNLQIKNSEGSLLVETLRDCQGRIQSMALIHEQLYQAKDLASIQVNPYLRNLGRNLFRTFGVDPQQIFLEIEGEVSLELDRAIPCGLIVNELVSNSLKYAFSKGAKGKISIEVHSVDSNLVLEIKDNGRGISGGIQIEKSSSLGLRLVHILSEQLEGKIELQTTDGVHCKITFPLERKKKRDYPF